MSKPKAVSEICPELLDRVDELEQYFRNGYRLQQSFRSYRYAEIHDAVARLKIVDPHLHRLLEYLWLNPDTSRNRIAAGREMDTNTLVRAWYRSFNIIMNYLNNAEYTPRLKSVNLVNYD
jgi:hypothetical protein